MWCMRRRLDFVLLIVFTVYSVSSLFAPIPDAIDTKQAKEWKTRKLHTQLQHMKFPLLSQPFTVEMVILGQTSGSHAEHL